MASSKWNFKEMLKDVEEWANNESYLIFDDNVVINLGV